MLVDERKLFIKVILTNKNWLMLNIKIIQTSFPHMSLWF